MYGVLFAAADVFDGHKETLLTDEPLYSLNLGASHTIAQALSGGVEHIVGSIYPGRTGKFSMDDFMSHWDAAITDAWKYADKLQAAHERIPSTSNGKYKEQIRRVLRRLITMKAVLQALIGGKLDDAREMLFTMQYMLLGTYENWGETYQANLQPFHNAPHVFGDINPHNIYAILGVHGDPSEISFEDIQSLIKTKILRLEAQYPTVKVAELTVAQLFERQMRYIFADAKTKECYDAWLKGPAYFSAWQQEELGRIGLTANELRDLAFESGENMLAFKSKLNDLIYQIDQSVNYIQTKTGIRYKIEPTND